MADFVIPSTVACQVPLSFADSMTLYVENPEDCTKNCVSKTNTVM